MREHWDLQRYIDELMEMARMEFEDVIDPHILNMKLRILKREMMERFTPEQMFMHGIVFENID